MNKGDTIYLELDFTINDEPLEKDEYDEIELQFNIQSTYTSLKLLMSRGDIEWNDDIGKYVAYLSQDDSFRLSNNAEYQLRIKYEDNVISSAIGTINIGEVLSRRVL